VAVTIASHSLITFGASLESTRASSCPEMAGRITEQLQKTEKRIKRKQTLRPPLPESAQELVCASCAAERAFLRLRMLRPASLCYAPKSRSKHRRISTRVASETASENRQTSRPVPGALKRGSLSQNVVRCQKN